MCLTHGEQQAPKLMRRIVSALTGRALHAGRQGRSEPGDFHGLARPARAGGRQGAPDPRPGWHDRPRCAAWHASACCCSLAQPCPPTPLTHFARGHGPLIPLPLFTACSADSGSQSVYQARRFLVLGSSGLQGVFHLITEVYDGVVGGCAGRPLDELSLPLLSLHKASSTSAQPPLALSEERVRAQNGRQLGCALITAFACCRNICGRIPREVDHLLIALHASAMPAIKCCIEVKHHSLVGAFLRSRCRSDMACWACRYVVVTRPVRQGRLKLALEEVLSMTVDTPTSRSAPSTASHATAPISPYYHHVL